MPVLSAVLSLTLDEAVHKTTYELSQLLRRHGRALHQLSVLDGLLHRWEERPYVHVDTLDLQLQVLRQMMLLYVVLERYVELTWTKARNIARTWLTTIGQEMPSSSVHPQDHLTDDVLDNWLLNELHFLDSSSDSESVGSDTFDDFEDQELNASENSDGDSDIQDMGCRPICQIQRVASWDLQERQD